MARHGAVNFQIGRAYPYLANVDPSYAELVRAIKRHLDPMNLMNPGALVGNTAS